MEFKVVGSGSKGNCYILEGEKEALIIEAGIQFKKILSELNYNLDKVIGLLVTHEHGDHSKSIKEFTKRNIPVFSSNGTLTALGLTPDNFFINALTPLKKTHIGEFSIMGFNVNHDAAEPFGYLIRHKECGNIVFITDSFYTEYTFPGVQHWIIEANYDQEILDQNMPRGSRKSFLRERIVASHSSIKNCEDILTANDMTNTKSIVLCHLSENNSDSESFLSRIRRVTGKPVYVAEKGQVINFSNH